MTSGSDPKSPWYRKLLDSLRPSSSTNTQTTPSYSNLIQIVALDIIDLLKLSKLLQPVSYQPKVVFEPGPGIDDPCKVSDEHHKGPKSAVCKPSIVCPLLRLLLFE
jgi:hypothetical protein